jgi:antitoxin ParD1/3/4
MPNVSKVSVSLPEDLTVMIDEAVKSGGYSSNSEVMREALRDWRVKRARVQALQEKIQTGFDDLEAGRVTEVASADELYQLILKN